LQQQKPKGKATIGDSIQSTAAVSAVAAEDQPSATVKHPSKQVKSKKAAAPKAEVGSPAPTPAPSTSKSSSSSLKVTNVASSSRKTVAASVASRSRSTSVMPGGADDTPSRNTPDDKGTKAERQEEEEDSDTGNDDDNRLYCVCKTKYDQERIMIACDR